MNPIELSRRELKREAPPKVNLQDGESMPATMNEGPRPGIQSLESLIALSCVFFLGGVAVACDEPSCYGAKVGQTYRVVL